ncbi:hypothetical protein V6N13_147918 [Hibiscus sabdariffa]
MGSKYRGEQSKQHKGKEQVILLFMENIPKTLHWKGLWFSFARHGEVVHAYIARKLSRGGKRFGFVRMSSMAEAERAIERLHVFRLYGSKLSVKLASRVKKERNRFEARSWRYGEEKRQKEEWNNNLKQVPMVNDTQRMNIDQSILLNRPRKCVKGHIDNEELWKMRKCLVGEMKTVCTVSSLNDRLHNWGLGEIGVQRMGAKTFLLTIEDEDLFLLLEDLEWSYLKEIFSDIKPWTETVSCRERATWLEFRGIPLNCWNTTTLRSLATVWGKFEALGCNAGHKRDCEKVTILISTSQTNKIEEVIELEVGDKVVEDKLEASSSSGSSSDQPQKEAAEGGRSFPDTEEEALKAMRAEKEINNSMNREMHNLRGLFREDELVGDKSQETTNSFQAMKENKASD